MALFLKNDTVYFQIPKTGGMWLNDVLRTQNLVSYGVADRHSDPVGVYLWHTPNMLKERVKAMIARRKLRLIAPDRMFCVVRNPYDWYESWFRYQSDPERNWRDWGTYRNTRLRHPIAALNGFPHGSFAQFVTAVADREPGFVSRMYDRYDSVDGMTVLRLETIRTEFPEFLRRTGARFNETKVKSHTAVNVSKRTQTEWTPALRGRIYDLERPAFVRYGYEK